MVEQEPGPSVDDRVVAVKARDKGVIRYVGSIDGQQGVWLGVEWDDPARGRHNGTVNGKTYFRAGHSTSGSLVKPTTVHLGKNLLNQIRERYADFEKDALEKIGGVVIEKIGMDKVFNQQRNYYDLSVIVLDGMLVATPPPMDTPKFENCRELNLHDNLLHRWEDVFAIISFFPNLKELILRHNHMQNVTDVQGLSHLPEITAPITRLVLNYCAITEITINALLSRFPNITDLYVSGNSLRSFNPGFHGRKLSLLDVELNPINSLSAIDSDNVLNSLESLSVQTCQITKLDCLKDRFLRLKSLNLRENLIYEWDSISALGDLKSLRNLSLTSTNLHGENELDVREMVIAKLPSITMLNRCDISAVERRSAELRFINRCSNLPETSITSFKEDLKRLIQLHGEPTIETSNKLKKINVIKVNIAYGEQSISRPLTLSMTISKIVTIAARLFSLDPNAICLLLEPKDGLPSELSNLARELAFYSVENGDTIRVEVN